MGCGSSSASSPSVALLEQLALEQRLLEEAESARLRRVTRSSGAGEEWLAIYREVGEVLGGLVAGVEARDQEERLRVAAEDLLLEEMLAMATETVMTEVLEDDHVRREVSAVMGGLIVGLELDMRCRRETGEVLRGLLGAVEENVEVRGQVAETLDFMKSLVERVTLALQEKDESDFANQQEAVITRVKQGWLLKLGHFRKNWKRRWFVLDGGILRYYVYPLDVPPYGSNLRGEINLEGYFVRKFPENPGKFELISLSDELAKRKEQQQRLSLSLEGLYSRSRASSKIKKTASTTIDAEDESNAEAWIDSIRKQQEHYFPVDTFFSEVDDYDTVFAEGPLGRKTRLSPWVDRWFVLKINKLEFFEDHTLKLKVGEFALHPYDSKVLPRDGIQRLRFSVVNGEQEQLELSCISDAERLNWVTMLLRVINRDFGKDYSLIYDQFRTTEEEDDDVTTCCDFDEIASEVMFDDCEEEIRQLRIHISRQVSELGFSDSDSDASLSDDESKETELKEEKGTVKHNADGKKDKMELSMSGKPGSPSSNTRHLNGVISTDVTGGGQGCDSTTTLSNSNAKTQHGQVELSSPSSNINGPQQPHPPRQAHNQGHASSFNKPQQEPTQNKTTPVYDRKSPTSSFKAATEYSCGDVDTQRETIALLRKQLRDKGETPLEYIPLEKLREEISHLVQLASQGLDHDEGRLDFCLKCLESHPQHKIEQEEIRQKWVAEITPYALQCLEIQRGFTPSHIFHSSVTSLVDNDDVCTMLAKRFLMKKCLWLVRVSKHDLSKMHIAELSGRFNPEAQGLDIIECAAIYMSLPDKFLNDHDGKKERWKSNVEAQFRSLYSKKISNGLNANQMRHPAYKTQIPNFIDDTALHKFGEVLKNTDQTEDEFILKSKAKKIGRRSSVATTTSLTPNGGDSSPETNDIFLARRSGNSNSNSLSLERQKFGQELNKNLRRNSMASCNNNKNILKPTPSFLDAIKEKQKLKRDNNIDATMNRKGMADNAAPPPVSLLDAIRKRKEGIE